MTVDPRFAGIVRLYGLDVFQRFQAATVIVAGIGGVGSWTAEALARSGVGHLVLVDADDLCVTNTNRQIHALEGQFGRSKVRVMAERLRLIDPQIRITEIPEFYSEKNSAAILDTAPAAVVDAIDSLRAKCHLLAACRERALVTVTSGAAGGRIDPTRIRIDDLARGGRDPLLASVRRKLRTEYGFPGSPARGEPVLYGIDAVFSDEAARYPTCDGGVSGERPAEMSGAIGCDAGYGSVTHLTAAFGFACAARVLDRL
ncbi:MAG: tRNA threonylcarbamoyladenosine dehydratase [Akkermansiaceae bacterium]|nr:tRNA threonylcarbamoyladenosine dehydratase [Akkermansiaceae bacterium]